MGWLATALLAGSLLARAADAPDGAALQQALEAHVEAGELDEALEAGAALLDWQHQQLGDDAPELAETLGWLGWVHELDGSYDAALESYSDALAQLERLYGPSDVRLTSAIDRLASALQSAGDLDGARALYERAERLCALGGVPAAVQVDVLNNHGTLLYGLGELEASRQRYEEALELVGQLGEAYRVDQADIQLNLATLLHELAQIDVALQLATEALETYRAELGPDSPYVATALNNLAAMNRDRGELQLARQQYEEALDRYTAAYTEVHPDVANVLSNLATLRAELGDLVQARRLLERSVSIYEATLGPEHIVVFDALHNLAGVLGDLGEQEEALARYEVVLERYAAVFGPDSLPVADALNNMAATWQDLGEFQRARPLLERSVAIYEQALGAGHPVTAEVRFNLALVCAQLGETTTAIAHLEQSIAVQRRVYGDEHWLLASSLVELSALELELGRPEAQVHLDEALRLAERRLDLLAALSDREGALWLDDLRTPLHLWLSTHRGPGAGREAWAHVLRWKGAGIRATQERLELARAAPATRSALEALRQARQRLAQAALTTPEPDQAEAHRARIEALTAERDAAERALNGAGGDVGARLSPSPERLCAALPEDVVLIDLFRVFGREGASYAALVVTPDCAVTRVDLPDADDIDARVRAWRTALAAEMPAADARGERLATVLWTPLFDHLPRGSRLWISPDAELAQLPWAALPVGPARRLVEDWQVQVLPSAAVLLAPPTTPGEGLLTIGGVDYGPTGDSAAACVSGDFPALPATTRESRALARRWRRRAAGPVTRLHGAGATEAALARAAPGARVLHIASHGWLAPEDCAEQEGLPSLLRSAVVLAGANRHDPPGSGLLTAEELADVDLRSCQLALLSACNTGRGEVRTGDGLLGLQRGLALAGAESAVLSLWAVEDAETASLMVRVVELVISGERPAAALRTAQLEALAAQRHQRGEDHPVSWGAWLVSGR